MFEQNGLKISLVAAASVAAFIAGFVAWHDQAALFGQHAGNFYKLMPHNTMAAIFGAAFLYAIVAMIMGIRNFWKDIGEPASTLSEAPSLWQAMKDASTLRYLDGGGVGCMNDSERPTDTRRRWHHFTFYGFLLCFASTSVATLYHYVLGKQAPYPWYDLPVLLGTLGGIGLVLGPIGLMLAKRVRDPMLVDESRKGMDVAFLVMLFLTGITGLALLVLRETAAMGLLLSVHLGVVFALFVTMPYGKFVHGIYRFLALVRYAKEKRMLEAGAAGAAAGS
jgi:citrate/tricarballylate utilization protein